MAGKPSNKDRLKEITDSIEKGIKELFESDRYRKYLATMSRFHRYSVNNTMLIYLQRPDATHVAGFGKWRDQFGRNVKKGERGIKIIAPTPFKKKIEEAKLDPDTRLPLFDQDGNAIMEEKEVKIPMYKPVTVFDIDQTEGKPLPQLASDLSGNVQNYEVFLEAVKRSSPVPVSIEVMTAGMDGYFDPEHQDIAIRRGMSEVQTVCAAIHEIGHAKLHNYEKAREQAAAGDGTAALVKKKDRNTEEVEAESISFAVCAYYGIETGENSFGYIASWSQGRELKELRASLETINKTASGLITDIDRHYAEIMKERGLDMAEPAQEEQEAVFLLDETAYLHVQTCDTGFNYTFYDRQTRKALDGGILDGDALQDFMQEQDLGIRLKAARDEILTLHERKPETITQYPPEQAKELLEELEAANALPMEQGQAQTEPEQTKPEQIKTEQTETTQPALTEPVVTEPPEEVPAAPITETQAETPEDRAEISHGVEEVPAAAAPDNGCVPDPAISVESMNAYGYTDAGMLPLTKERALELAERDVTVYMLYEDNTEAMAFDTDEIRDFGGIFGIAVEDWEAIKGDYVPPERPDYEKAFLENPGDAYAIYQLRRDDSTAQLRFMNMDYLERKGYAVEHGHYEAAYAGDLTIAGDTHERLNQIFTDFNINRPDDFTGHSLSVSDIVALRQNGVVSCHYVDSWGFKELPGFLKPENYLKNAEMATEDDYGMIDGIINNGKAPSVAELEQQAKSGTPISLLDLAAAVHREEQEKRKGKAEPQKAAARPSVLSKLKAPAPAPRPASTAPKKSAEREL